MHQLRVQCNAGFDLADMKRKGLAAMIATIMSTTLMMIVLMTMKAKDREGVD